MSKYIEGQEVTVVRGFGVGPFRARVVTVPLIATEWYIMQTLHGHNFRAKEEHMEP